MTIHPYKEHPQCPKCPGSIVNGEHRRTNLRFCNRGKCIEPLLDDMEHLHVTCCMCDYEWLMECKDSDDVRERVQEQRE